MNNLIISIKILMNNLKNKNKSIKVQNNFKNTKKLN